MHDFLAWSRCFVVRCAARCRSSRRCSRIVRSTKALKLCSTRARSKRYSFGQFIVSTLISTAHTLRIALGIWMCRDLPGRCDGYLWIAQSWAMTHECVSAIVTMREQYFDDLKVGNRFKSEPLNVTETHLIEFAHKFDPQMFQI